MRMHRSIMVSLAAIAVAVLTALAAPGLQDRVTIRTPGSTFEISRGARPFDLERGGLFILSLAEGANAETTLEQVAAAGGRTAGYLGGQSWWLRLPAGFDTTELPADATLVRARAGHKMPERMRGAAPAGGSLRVSLRFFRDADPTAARALLERQAGISLDAIPYGDAVEFAAAPALLNRLAASDLVENILPAPQRMAHNNVAAARSHIDTARANYGIDGTNVRVGIVDGGAVDDSHPDFTGRITLVDTGSDSDHSTHVAGTILGAGVNNANATGMAPAAHGWSWNFNGEVVDKMAAGRAGYGVDVINNSWGAVSGWNYSSTRNRDEWHTNLFFGLYYNDTAALDRLIYETGVFIVFSAGNDRNDVGPANGHYWEYDPFTGTYTEKNDPATMPGPDGPYLIVDTYASAKNTITVGATDGADSMSDFSSWGPTKDGRLKPELVAKGVSTISCNLNNAYSIKSGTSMAAPVVTGGIALITEHFRALQGRSPRPDELKGILTMTALDLGPTGPDYSYGYGLLDVDAAARLISADADQNLISTGTAVKPTKKVPGRYFKFSIPAGTKTLKAAIVWTDPEGPVLEPIAENWVKSVLVNDLDLQLHWIKEKKRRTLVKSFKPWVLTPASPHSSAVRGINKLDNIEQVLVTNPKAGDWYVEVKGTRFGQGNSQPFALIVWADKNLLAKVEPTGVPDVFKPKKK